MKKILALILVGTMVFCFGACSKSTNNSEAKNTQSTTAQTKGGSTESTTNSKSSNNEKETTTVASNGKTTTSAKSDYVNSNEIIPAPKGAVVADSLKAKKCKANIQSLPCYVESKYLPSRNTKAKATINKCTYSFSDAKDGKAVILKLNINGTKRSDAESGTLACGFLIKVFDSKNNLVGQVYALTPKTESGKDFEYFCYIGGLTDTQYSVAFANVER